jgi:hypothetical protein
MVDKAENAHSRVIVGNSKHIYPKVLFYHDLYRISLSPSALDEADTPRRITKARSTQLLDFGWGYSRAAYFSPTVYPHLKSLKYIFLFHLTLGLFKTFIPSKIVASSTLKADGYHN